MKTRYFWLVSDKKTVREISWNEYRQFIDEDFNRKNTRKLARNDGSEIYIHKGKSGMWISMAQLKAILEA